MSHLKDLEASHFRKRFPCGYVCQDNGMLHADMSLWVSMHAEKLDGEEVLKWTLHH